jgi:hypothetical protein
MKADRTRIAIILDRSGSMNSVRESTVTGFNEFIKKQREMGGDVSVKLCQFDHEYEVVFDKPLAEVPELTQNNFVPRGNTALYDAQGRTIVTLGEELAAMAEEERPSKVIVMTLTDGLENASREYKLDAIAAMIKHQQERYSWEFLFLGANQDAIFTARTMNIAPRSAMSYSSNPMAMRATMVMASNYVSESRRQALRRAGFSSALAQDAPEFSDAERMAGLVKDASPESLEQLRKAGLSDLADEIEREQRKGR